MIIPPLIASGERSSSNHLLKKTIKLAFEKVYNTYSSMVYSIALETSANQTKASEITIHTFKILCEQNATELNSHCLCATIIKLTIETAHKILKPTALKHNFNLKIFENCPLLRQLLLEQMSMDKCCEQNNLNRAAIALKLRDS